MPQVGRFSWFELNTPDPVAAREFYGAVFGWTTQTLDMGGGYTMWVAPSGPVGGVSKLSDAAVERGAPPHWVGTVSVHDIAATVAQAQELGAQVRVPIMDMPGASRFALLVDPHGATFGVHQSGQPSDPAEVDPRRGIGEFSWAELMTSDPEAAFEFYAALFGWEKKVAMEMGEMGTYQMFGRVDAPSSMGGMMRSPPGMTTAAWLHYANVADIEACAARVRAGGGKIMHGPADVPGGGHILMFVDPQGAASAAFSER